MKNAKSLLLVLGTARRSRDASMSEDKERVRGQVHLNSLPLPGLMEPGPLWPGPLWSGQITNVEVGSIGASQ